jgi:ADP-ribose pyrophosphatase YjhB (NUDIX family)
MLKQLLIASFALFPALASAGAQLTDMETRWLKAASPVLAYSQRIKLPIDIIVQPQARPNDVPLAMGFMDGRCKLVLSMRGNPDAEKVLDKVPEAQRGVLMEAMAAHEVGHCWRYAQGAWHALPAGFVETGEETADDPALLVESKAMRENRREEGFSDLVALAWTKRHHPESYSLVYNWLAELRKHQPVAGSGHDTRVWVRLASDGSVFQETASPFEDARSAWRQGLLNDE